MKITAIVAEYNPFHKGHEYQLNEAIKITDADYTICVLSSDFTQRGLPSVCNKYIRTEMALSMGVDAVIELPSYYSTESAIEYAFSAVKLLDSLGCVDSIVFGCECDDIELLYALSEIPLLYKNEYNNLIKGYVSVGLSYPRAEAKAIMKIIEDFDEYENEFVLSYSLNALESVLASSNNTLALCYLRALIVLRSNIKPYCVKRIVSEHFDDSLGSLSSSAVRKELLNLSEVIISGDEKEEKKLLNLLSEQLPENSLDIICETVNHNIPLDIDDFSLPLIYKIRSIIYNDGMSIKSAAIVSLMEYVDISDALAGKIINNINHFESVSQFCALLKTKEMTYSRIMRGLIHILLDIKKSNLEKYISNDYSLYARILGFREDGAGVLSEIKDYSRIPVISKLSDADRIIEDPLTLNLFYENTYASELYEQVLKMKFKGFFKPEFTNSPVIY